ncbi:hypothetical protein N0V82_008020 [Gnomoniopsis sp. IMI 355080]|nr:hypothetical protein N0V82_008020 [Gnomoniopsis sp. IMI 355080]
MNFHISNLSPLRPQFSSSSLGASRSQPSPRLPSHEATHHNTTTTGTGPVKIAVEPADDLSSSNPGTDDDDDNDDDDTDDADALSDISADENDDVTQDSRDVLVQRLTDLAERIGSANANVRTSCIEALHKQVDEMERLLRGSSRDRSTSRQSHAASSSQQRRGAPSSLQQPGASSRPRSLQLPMVGQSGSSGSDSSSRGRESLGVMPPMSPSWLMSHFQRRPSVHQEEEAERSGHNNERSQDSNVGGVHLASTSSPSTAAVVSKLQPERPSVERMASLDSSTSAPRISSQVAEDAIKEAEKLCAEMATVIESLQTRRQESDHLQTIFINGEEVAHKRLYETALVTGELEDVVADHEAELRHLRLELRAIEVQCMGYVPKDADPELERSIRNWKEDWYALKEKYASRKGSSFVSRDDDSSTVYSVLASPVSQRS